MGFYDRDYYHDDSQRGGLASFNMWSITTWLIIINVAVFLLDLLVNGAITEFGYFSQDLAIGDLELWRFITFQFLHANLTHIFFNMLGLYFFGPIVESHLGARKYLAFYLICGMGGAAGYLLLNVLGFFHDGPFTSLVGASAGIFGVLVAAGRIAPDVQVMLLLPPIPMRLRTLAWVCVGIAAFTVITQGGNAGGQAAHLGGAAVGLILISKDNWLNWANFRRRPKRGGRFKDWSKDFNR